jgi:hypothetical protein
MYSVPPVFAILIAATGKQMGNSCGDLLVVTDGKRGSREPLADAERERESERVADRDRDGEVERDTTPPRLRDRDTEAERDVAPPRLRDTLRETDGLRVGDVAFPLMLTAPKLILPSFASLRELKMRAHMMGWPAAASGSLAVMR